MIGYDEFKSSALFSEACESLYPLNRKMTMPTGYSCMDVVLSFARVMLLLVNVMMSYLVTYLI